MALRAKRPVALAPVLVRRLLRVLLEQQEAQELQVAALVDQAAQEGLVVQVKDLEALVEQADQAVQQAHKEMQ